MKFNLLAAAAMAGLIALSFPRASTAQNAEAIFSTDSMKPEIALDLAKSALDICRAAGYQVAIAVVDRSGLTQVVLRDRFAGAHTVDTATRKAWTAVSFRTATLDLGTLVKESPVMAGLPDITNALVLGGGIPVQAAGNIVGGIGISGAPGADLDHECAEKAIEKFQDLLDF
ncbi:heme-binding protein [Nisaea acidiphila]|uniref:Heme-binding protein n=1 Tax=Nisaea acidiphila TaxID=1862145 RepID=A0A9J7B1K7_9PROT|nr:heme-binding protein [Nisaea acidiphila]UUX51549.1 heme-binding protein [Nisaea acidiphila]